MFLQSFVSNCRDVGLESLAVGRSQFLLLPAGEASGPSDVIRLSFSERKVAWSNGSSGHTASWQVERCFAKRLFRFVNEILEASVTPLSAGSRESP